MENHNKPECKCCCEDRKNAPWRQYLPVAVSFTALVAGLAADHLLHPVFFAGWVRAAWYGLAYLPVGLPVMVEGVQTLRKGEFFTEYTLMVAATIGAMAIGQYAEGVAVMLFYAVGELFQQAAVGRAKRSIQALLDQKPGTATVIRDGKRVTADPRSVAVGETVEVRAGEKVPLDGVMLSDSGSFDTAALTGESRPRAIGRGGQLLAGMIAVHNAVEMRVSKPYEDSSFVRILEMVQQASSRKARTELVIRRLARFYTPAVFALAVALAAAPYFFVSDYVFGEWFYRALIFLVVSCPCALVISVPLGYFGGIGAGSRNGILFKGSNFLDVIARADTVAMDKTGTMTEGVFAVQRVEASGMDAAELITLLAALESASTHPVARAVAAYAGDNAAAYKASGVREFAGEGLSGMVDGRQVLAGNAALMRRFDVAYDASVDAIAETVVLCAVDGLYAGCVVIADRLKSDAAAAVESMKRAGVKLTVMLSGDKDSITLKTAAEAGIDRAYGGLLPEDKLHHVESLRKEAPGRIVAFVGDGLNDAPVLAASDVGIAMGAMGTDAAIETADVVIQTDQPSKIAVAINIGRQTRRIVWQNIALALGVKAAVMLMGALGLATMWEAVFADVGVALLAILNAVRIQRMKF